MSEFSLAFFLTKKNFRVIKWKMGEEELLSTYICVNLWKTQKTYIFHLHYYQAPETTKDEKEVVLSILLWMIL
jgi:hypothetical protein